MSDDTATLWGVGIAPDLDPSQRRIGGVEAIGHRIGRRCVTRRGLLPYATEAGRDLRDYLESTEDLDLIASEVSAEAEAVDGVVSVDTQVSRAADGSVSISVAADTIEGAAKLTLSISQAGTAFTLDT